MIKLKKNPENIFNGATNSFSNSLTLFGKNICQDINYHSKTTSWKTKVYVNEKKTYRGKNISQIPQFKRCWTELLFIFQGTKQN